MQKTQTVTAKNFEFDVFLANSILRIEKVNLPEKEENEEKPKSVGVFDIESNGHELLFGFYNGSEYKYKIIRNSKDATEVLDWLTSVDVSYFYGDYDIPVTLSPFLSITHHSSLREKNLADNIYVVKADRIYTIMKLKNLYKITDGERESLSINLLTFYAGSLYDSYTSFYGVIRQVFGNKAFDEKTLKEWKEDKAKRKDFENVNLEDPEIMKGYILLMSYL